MKLEKMSAGVMMEFGNEPRCLSTMRTFNMPQEICKLFPEIIFPHSWIGTLTVTLEHLRTKTLYGCHGISQTDPGTASKILVWLYAWMQHLKMYPCPIHMIQSLGKALSKFPLLCPTQWILYSLGNTVLEEAGALSVGFGASLTSSESAKVKGV